MGITDAKLGLQGLFLAYSKEDTHGSHWGSLWWWPGEQECLKFQGTEGDDRLLKVEINEDSDLRLPVLQLPNPGLQGRKPVVSMETLSMHTYYVWAILQKSRKYLK